MAFSVQRAAWTPGLRGGTIPGRPGPGWPWVRRPAWWSSLRKMPQFLVPGGCLPTGGLRGGGLQELDVGAQDAADGAGVQADLGEAQLGGADQRTSGGILARAPSAEVTGAR